MRPIYLSEKVDCGLFREYAYHLQAGELAGADREKLQEHLDTCEACARYLAVENSFLRGLKARIVEEEVPEGLEARIREALEREAPSTRRTPWGWLWSPVTATLAAALILVAVLVPTFRGTSGLGSGEAVPIHGRIVTIVDEDCDQAGGSIEEQRACVNDRHLNALKVGDGMYWHVSLDSPEAKEIVLDPRQRGRVVVVEATYYPAINTVKLIDVQDLVALNL